MKATKKKVLALTLSMTAGLTATALAATSTVTLVTVAGSRAFTTKTLTGDDLTAISLSSGGEAPFLVNVTDAAYDRKNYQVTAMMSNLYQYDPVAGSFDCGAPAIPASKTSIDYLPNPTSVRDVAAIAEPVLQFTGEITDPVLLASLGLTAPTSIAVRSKQKMQSFSKSAAYYGTEEALPLKVSKGAGGAFTNAAPHSACSPSGSGSTSVQIQDGSINSAAQVLEWVQASATDLFESLAGPDGLMSVSEAVAGGIIDSEVIDADVRAALTSAPINADPLMVTEATIGQVKGLLSAALAEVTSIVRQTGSYSTLPKLVVGDLSGIPTGTYRGTLTLTLIES